MLCDQENPGFGFTSIQVNASVRAKPHVDKQNKGASRMLCLGEYEGGDTWYHDGEGDGEYTCEKKLSKDYDAGTKLRGSTLKTRNRWIHFDGNRLHYTLPFTGERFALIYFTSDKFYGCPERLLATLRLYGFAKYSENPHQQTANENLQPVLPEDSKVTRETAKEYLLDDQEKDSDDESVKFISAESSSDNRVSRRSRSLEHCPAVAEPSASSSAPPPRVANDDDQSLIESLLEELERCTNVSNAKEARMKEEHENFIAERDIKYAIYEEKIADLNGELRDLRSAHENDMSSMKERLKTEHAVDKASLLAQVEVLRRKAAICEKQDLEPDKKRPRFEDLD
eukprot:GEMP01036121.1.p1 GENE.GEMP01036121.1~~GEMP01036121.1.p1  ORF type:complete len:340 (+),score=75.47 GEMP01036121.1:96-1115(+)